METLKNRLSRFKQSRGFSERQPSVFKTYNQYTFLFVLYFKELDQLNLQLEILM